jgi:hypothetical protein
MNQLASNRLRRVTKTVQKPLFFWHFRIQLAGGRHGIAPYTNRGKDGNPNPAEADRPKG